MRTEELGRPPRFKRLFWDLGLCYLEECEYVGQEKEGEKRTLSPSVIIHFQMKSKMAAAANMQSGGVLTLSLVSCKGSGEKG